MINSVSNLGNDVYLTTQYKFKNENLLFEVFSPPYVHSGNTTSSPSCFERLEFLGDSVLNVVISIILFELYPLENEGDLTLRKNDLVSGRRLAEVARNLRLMKFMPEVPGKVWRRESDTMEALIGAIFLDGGFNSAKNIIVRNWKKLARQIQQAPVDSKSQLYMWAQKNHLPAPLYKVVNKTKLDLNYTLTLQLKGTHGLGIVKVITNLKKRGEAKAARAMLARIENREKWKRLFNSNEPFITEDNLNSSLEDIKMRLYLWCKAHGTLPPQYKTTQSETADRKIQFTSLVYFSSGRGAYGVSSSGAVAEKKAALKMMLRLCDEEREQKMLSGVDVVTEIDLCIPRDFKSLMDEWVSRNHIGDVRYFCEELKIDKLFNVSITISNTDFGVIFAKSYKKKLAELRAAALMINKIVTNPKPTGVTKTNELCMFDELNDPFNYKVKLHSWTHSKKMPSPVYKVEHITGPDHNLSFTVSVSVDGQIKTVAKAFNKRLAEQRAACLMLDMLRARNKLVVRSWKYPFL